MFGTKCLGIPLRVELSKLFTGSQPAFVVCGSIQFFGAIMFSTPDRLSAFVTRKHGFASSANATAEYHASPPGGEEKNLPENSESPQNRPP
ncbi:hypothetical protein BaRGS_00004777 [Batillaria attramentaria]|uniref:Uncharacterized protein n=1 Tax=Batillaria attramentaria TaxID=370345 RepID=A0ABD0LXZ8_9CAEN